MMKHYKNYHTYADAVREQTNMSVYVPDITADNIEDHIQGIYAILKDGIETDYVHNLMVNVSWGGDIECDLYVIDYWFSLFMWKMILKDGQRVEPKHIFYSKELKKHHITDYVNKYILTRDNKINLGNEFLNNNICDGLWAFSYIEAFAYYLANTINNEDNIELMDACPEFYDLLHTSYANIPIADVKKAGMDVTNRAIEIIKDSKRYIGYKHGLAASFEASEGINPRQYKETQFNIGAKPNGTGGVYPYIINKSFANGGVNDLFSYFIEANSSRYAQILSKKNVGTSGDFARILGLNNTDTFLNIDMNYDCGTKNFITYDIKTKKHLSMIRNRYYRNSINGIYHLIDIDDTSLIGKTILMRSPCKCASLSEGRGICRKCYGDLYFTNLNINVGKYAAENLSSQLTQKLLSAKHLLEVIIISLLWNPEFKDWFEVDGDAIILTDLDDIANVKKYQLLIDPEDINLVSDEEDTISVDDDDDDVKSTEMYNEYISHFYIRTPDGTEIKFGSQDQDPLYLSTDLNNIIRKKAIPDEGRVSIPLSSLQDFPLFFVRINNNEISKTMDDIINIINKGSVMEHLNADTAVQSIVDLVIDGKLNIDAVHLEVILANQTVSIDDMYKKPNWRNPEVLYRMFTLNQALTNNKSVVVSLLYKDLHKVFYNPLTYTKNAPSFFDLFFHEQPQVYMTDQDLNTKPVIEDNGIKMVRIVSK